MDQVWEIVYPVPYALYPHVPSLEILIPYTLEPYTLYPNHYKVLKNIFTLYPKPYTTNPYVSSLENCIPFTLNPVP